MFVGSVSPKPPIQPTEYMKDRKLCPLPVPSFTGRKDILEKMHRYFDRDRGSVYCFFSFNSAGGVTRDREYHFGTSANANLQRDTSENFDNFQHARPEFFLFLRRSVQFRATVTCFLSDRARGDA